MAQALNAGPTPRRRTFFGLLDADGWAWASLKALIWFIVIIFLLGYIPDRAYYFTVNRTLDLGVLAISPINLCPPANEGLDCPAPPGSVRPWHPSPQELSLPAPRTDAAAVQLGSRFLLIGGSDGTTATNEVLTAPVVPPGNFDRWEQGPALPEARANAAVAFFNGSVYVAGGSDDGGQATTTVYTLTPDPTSGELAAWEPAEALSLPEARTGAALVPLGDGLLLVGGSDGSSAVDTVWKASLDGETLGAWEPQRPLVRGVTDAVAVANGDFVWVYGGTEADGSVTGAVQRGTVDTGAVDDGHGGTVIPEGAVSTIAEWGVRPVGNLPEPRTNAAGWTANGVLYLVGGSDGSRPRGELYWTIPEESGDLGDIVTEWRHTPVSDLPTAQGLAGAAPVVSGADVVLIGGTTADGPITGAARANLAPEEPFFQLGLVGATVPALQLEGELGQQLGYLNAAGAGTLNFAILIVVGWMFAHRERTRAFWHRISGRGRRR